MRGGVLPHTRLPLVSSMTRLVVVHDVLGTLFSLTSPINELLAIFADQLESEKAPPILAELIVMVSACIRTACRENCD